MMTMKAQELGMTHTHFVNANGLPDSRQITSARDIAILCRAVLRDYPQYYHYFGTENFTYRGRDDEQPQRPAGTDAGRRWVQDRLHQRRRVQSRRVRRP